MIQAYREWDFSNMLTVLLRFNGRPVAAAVLRVFGQQLAELPLVATRPDARRQGHARVMVRAIEAMLVQLGVQVSTGPDARRAHPASMAPAVKMDCCHIYNMTIIAAGRKHVCSC
jgi:GNAT superfamily N-acetyltransferase